MRSGVRTMVLGYKEFRQKFTVGELGEAPDGKEYYYRCRACGEKYTGAKEAHAHYQDAHN